MTPGTRLLAGALAWLATATPAPAAELRVMPSAAYAGFFGLEIEVGTDCAAPDQVVVSAPPAVLASDVLACRQIEASGVEVTGDVTLTAGEVIALGEELRVTEGASLTVALDPRTASDFASIANSSPQAEATYRARFHLLLDGLSLVAGEEVEHFRGETDDGSALFRLVIRPDAGSSGHLLGLAALESAGWRETPAGQELALAPGWNEIEIDWVASDPAGHWLVSVNGAGFDGLSGLGNGSLRLDRIRWGAVDGLVSGAPGTLRVDGFSSWR